MKLGQIVNMESLSLVPAAEIEQPPMADVDPKDIPAQAIDMLTPTLEVEEKSTDPFPEEYIPSTLQALKENLEALDYTTNMAEENVNLLQTSLDVVRDTGDISPMSMVSIVAQLKVAANTSTVDDSLAIDKLTKELTSDNPYRYAATLEAITETMATMRSVVVRGIHPLITVNNFINKNVNINATVKQLQETQTVMMPSKTLLVNNLQYFDKIAQAITDDYSVDKIPGIITSSDGKAVDIPITACAAIARGMRTIPLIKDRVLSNEDIISIIKLYETVAAAQQAMTTLLDTISSPMKVPNFNESTLTAAAATFRQACGVFWSTIVSLDCDKLQDNTRQYAIIKDWPGVILKDTGKSCIPDLSNTDNYATIDPKTVSDIVTFTLSDVIPKFKVIIKNAHLLASKASEIEQVALQVMSEKVSLTDTAGIHFQNTLFRVADASKFTANLTSAAVQSMDLTTKAYFEISRGIGILNETS